MCLYFKYIISIVNIFCLQQKCEKEYIRKMEAEKIDKKKKKDKDVIIILKV